MLSRSMLTSLRCSLSQPRSSTLRSSSVLLFHPSQGASLLRSQQRSMSTDAEAALMATLKNGIKESMKSKDVLTSTVLRSILSEYQYSTKRQNGQVSKLSRIITKAIARRKDAAKQFKAAKPPRLDLAEQEEKEANILREFLPPQ